MGTRVIEIKCKGSGSVHYAALTPFQGDLKSLSVAEYRKLKKNILTLGFSSPIHVWACDGVNYILDGHQRLDAITRMVGEGYSVGDLPVVEVEAESHTQAKLKVLALTSQYGVMGIEGLKEFSKDLDLSIPDMDGLFRFPEIDLSALHGEGGTEGLTDDDAVPEEVESICKSGDLWELGDHRLLCGDCTDAANVEMLMGGEKADMVFTDPPYNLGFEYNSYDDNMPADDYKSFCSRWFYNLTTVCQKIVITPGTKNLPMWCNINGDIRGIACWVKKNWTTSCSIANLQQWEPISFYGDFKRSRPSDLFEINRKYQADVGKSHSCPKQIELLEDIFGHYAEKYVLDIFMGSGSTLIACEKTGRKCYGMEIDPHYCDVTITRWEQFTGKKAVNQYDDFLL